MDYVIADQCFMITDAKAPAALAAFQRYVAAKHARSPYFDARAVLAAITLPAALRAFGMQEVYESVDEMPYYHFGSDWAGVDPESVGPGAVLGLVGRDDYWFEDEWLPVLAPFVEPGCFLEYEDPNTRERWRFEFDGVGVKTLTGKIAWS